jgi:DNA-binding response OmpR family regulator
VVDDSVDNRIILSRCVKRAGYDVIMAEDGPSALEKIAQQAPALVLLDWMMPGLSGPETLHAIRAQYDSEQLPVIMCTARTAPSDVRAALAAGANDYITKPLDIAVAMTRIERQLQRRAGVEQESADSHRQQAGADHAPSSEPEREANDNHITEALEEIVRLVEWLQDAAEANNPTLRAACATAIAAAARRLAAQSAGPSNRAWRRQMR